MTFSRIYLHSKANKSNPRKFSRRRVDLRDFRFPHRQMAYRWRTDGVQMAYRWRTDGVRMAYGARILQGRGDDIVFHAQRRRQADFELRSVKSVHRRRRRRCRRRRRGDDFADLLN